MPPLDSSLTKRNSKRNCSHGVWSKKMVRVKLFMVAISMMLSFHILFLSSCYCTPGDDSVGPSSKRRKRNKTAPPFKRRKRDKTALPFKRRKHDTADITTSELPEGCYYHCCISRVERYQLFMVAILLIL